ncbi:AraC family transcriptional regulator [bacterium]|nr:AraC family transcriptional regulator [bacterium]
MYVLSECMEDFGLKQDEWLAGSSISAIDSNLIEELVDFGTFRHLALRAAEMANNPTIGLAIGQRLSLHSHGILGYAALNSATLRDAANLIESYISIRMPLVDVRSQSIDDNFVLMVEEKEPLGDVYQFLFDGLLLTLKNALLQLLPQLREHITVHFKTAPHPNFPYQSVFGDAVKFNEPFAGLSGPEHFMETAIPHANALAFQEAESLCRKAFEQIVQEHPLTTKTKKKLLEAPGQFPTLEVLASYFNMTPRTLHRRLKSEGTSYKQILDDVKLSLALAYLADSEMSIKEIAYFLGYDELSNFRRAFKRWHGTTPSEYRATQRDETS